MPIVICGAIIIRAAIIAIIQTAAVFAAAKLLRRQIFVRDGEEVVDRPFGGICAYIFPDGATGTLSIPFCDVDKPCPPTALRILLNNLP